MKYSEKALIAGKVHYFSIEHQRFESTLIELMTILTRKLIRKKAEHHEDILPELEEISLHQLEIEKIEVIGDICRKLKILYLQNNIISKIENLNHCKDMEYLNLALNNIERIEGLRTMEFLRKLDLTVNFIDCDTFEESIAELRYNRSLRELYLMGNPSTDWSGHRHFVIGVLPSLEELDGKAITRTERIQAKQEMQHLLKELRVLAKEARTRKMHKLKEPYDEEAYSTRSRLEMYREISEEKQEQEDRKKGMEPRERDYETEHLSTLQKQRKKEREQGVAVRQCNEGRYKFRMTEEDGEGNVILEIDIPKFVDTSLVDVDVQPTYVSVVIKNKTVRLTFPEEVKPDDGIAQRSQITGTLKLVLPKLDPTKALRSYKIQKAYKLKENVKMMVQNGDNKQTGLKIGHEMLEIGINAKEKNILNVVRDVRGEYATSTQNEKILEYIDDSCVPPLE
jgi:protein TilB